ncbi:hypothetical protein [Pseudonocardia asaccharolytica]|uniref:Uncharacterized protein n=1 Tax=Pseudonocardia asaccharolytica DSM 44247 = NBRC 16224 TaxID=1123024 RepID=A0A511D5V0_9PSEU|nr:hypothetical protein [Pseudonocardia asaccharolytica]GEL20037.1 hypothetical protein PA7_38740 [Pseudonocardia asaccharolytica DSM 44247 = NBRC 16224]
MVEPDRSPAQPLKDSVRDLLVVLARRALGVALDKVEAVADGLEEIASRGGVATSAALGGGRALLEGRNPAWSALKAGVAALPAGITTFLVLTLILVLLLGPVLLLILLVLLLVWAVVAAIRAGR